jgi:hypothetical protein
MRRAWGMLVALVAIAACRGEIVPTLQQPSADGPSIDESTPMPSAPRIPREGGIARDGTTPPPPPQRPNTCRRPGVTRPFSTLTELHTFISFWSDKCPN